MTDARHKPLHAVAVAVAADADGPLAGILLLGEPGAGKSQTALSLVGRCPWRRTALIADDAVDLTVREGALVAKPPAPLLPLIEVRGFGPARVRMLPATTIRLCLDLSRTPERAPEPLLFEAIPGASVPLYAFDVRHGAPDVRIRAMLRTILGGQS